jgi:hypothetical protein
MRRDFPMDLIWRTLEWNLALQNILREMEKVSKISTI